MDEAAADLIEDFVSGTHTLSAAMKRAMEEKLLLDTQGPRVTFSQLMLLKLVAMRGAFTIRGVAAFLRVSTSAASKAVDKLVRQNLLQRAEEQADRRQIRLSLTDSGCGLLAAYENARAQKLDQIFAPFSPSVLRHCMEVLDRMSARMIGSGAQAGEPCILCGVYFRRQCPLRHLTRQACFYHGSPASGWPGLPADWPRTVAHQTSEEGGGNA